MVRERWHTYSRSLVTDNIGVKGRGMRILIVEDDEFKAEHLRPILHGLGEIVLVQSVREAVVTVLSDNFDLVVLDMALPTFTKSTLSSGGTAQAQGGMEVIRALKSRQAQIPIIIVSQYPDLEIEGSFLALQSCPAILRERYQVNLVGAVLFDFDDKSWEETFKGLLGEACEF